LKKKPLPERKIDEKFCMYIEGVFSISGRGTVITGCIDKGSVKPGDEVEIVGKGDKRIKTVVTGVEMYRKALPVAYAGDNIGLLVRGVDKNAVVRGDVVGVVGSIKTYKSAIVDLYVVSKEEGGRHTQFTINYRPQFFIKTADETGTIKLISALNGTTLTFARPGDTIRSVVEFEHLIPLDKIHFAVREGGKTVASGKIIEIFKTYDDASSYLITNKASLFSEL